MSRKLFIAALAATALLPSASHAADSIDGLKGQFAFDWHIEPEKTKCAAVDDALIALFKSDKFTCELVPVTNTASGEAARTCTEKGDSREYLIFETQKACEAERETQASNGD